MSLKLVKDGRFGTVGIAGRLTSAHVLEPLLSVASEARRSGIDAVLVDFSGARLRPCAMGALVEICSRLSPETRLAFCGLPADAIARLRRDGLDRCLPIHPDVATARAAPGFADLELAGTRALILCDRSADFLPTERPGPVALVDILGRPILGHLLQGIVAQGIRDVLIAPGAFEADLRAALSRNAPSGMSVSVLQPCPDAERGRPGQVIARLARSGALPSDDLVVLDGCSPGVPDLRSMMRAHRTAGSGVTAAIRMLDDPNGSRVAEQGTETRFGSGMTSAVPLSGAFILAPEVVARAPFSALQPLGAERLPRADAHRDGVALYPCSAPVRRIGSARDLWQEQFERLEGRGGITMGGVHGTASRVEIAEDARIDGTVFIGADACIGAGVSILGPAFIGAGAAVGAGATLRRCLVLPGTEVEAGAVLADCVAGPAGLRPIAQNRMVRDLKLSATPLPADELPFASTAPGIA